MIVQDIHIEGYSWDVRIFYAVSRYDVGQIMQALHSIGCRATHAADAYRSLQRNALDSGLTFSNYRLRRSVVVVVVVALASSAKQFHRCLIHELRHLQSHIASADNINEKSEQVCYLLDEIVGLVHDECYPLLCSCCRDKNRQYHGNTGKGKGETASLGRRSPLPVRRRMLPQLR